MPGLENSYPVWTCMLMVSCITPWGAIREDQGYPRELPTVTEMSCLLSSTAATTPIWLVSVWSVIDVTEFLIFNSS